MAPPIDSYRTYFTGPAVDAQKDLSEKIADAGLCFFREWTIEVPAAGPLQIRHDDSWIWWIVGMILFPLALIGLLAAVCSDTRAEHDNLYVGYPAWCQKLQVGVPDLKELRRQLEAGLTTFPPNLVAKAIDNPALLMTDFHENPTLDYVKSLIQSGEEGFLQKLVLECGDHYDLLQLTKLLPPDTYNRLFQRSAYWAGWKRDLADRCSRNADKRYDNEIRTNLALGLAISSPQLVIDTIHNIPTFSYGVFTKILATRDMPMLKDLILANNDRFLNSLFAICADLNHIKKINGLFDAQPKFTWQQILVQLNDQRQLDVPEHINDCLRAGITAQQIVQQIGQIHDFHFGILGAQIAAPQIPQYLQQLIAAADKPFMEKLIAEQHKFREAGLLAPLYRLLLSQVQPGQPTPFALSLVVADCFSLLDLALDEDIQASRKAGLAQLANGIGQLGFDQIVQQLSTDAHMRQVIERVKQKIK
jgi:hypothetical protein